MKRVLIIILIIVVFVALVAFFGSKQGLRRLSILGSLFTAEFQDKQQKQAQPSGSALQGVAEATRVPEKHSSKETKQIGKRSAKPGESPATESPSNEPKITQRGNAKGAVKVRRVAAEKCDTWLRFRTTP